MISGKKINDVPFYALVFGIFLGLCLCKFGNPVILDSKIPTPISTEDFLNDPWPTRWADWILLPLTMIGLAIFLLKKTRWPATKLLWVSPLLWFGWQLFSATRTVDASLTMATLWQFFGCISCYFIGALIFNGERILRWLMVGILAAFTFCLVRAIDQRLVEFPKNRDALVEGERTGWTNFPTQILAEMKRENIVITTNGVDVANPVILAKFGKETPANASGFQRLFFKLFASTPRVNGTLVYPNALAGAILLLFPVSFMFALNHTKQLRQFIRLLVILLTMFLGIAGLFWTGSKLGWLIGMAMSVTVLLRLRWSRQIKCLAFSLVVLLGLGIFGMRFHNYFAAGATSAGARFDYWRAATQIAGAHPLTGTGPGTFQQPYSQIKSPEAEMARLTHNDYLEQFSDSGIIGGTLYVSWILALVITIGKRIWTSGSPINFAIFIGLLAWLLQGMGEFSLYIPGLAWPAFTFMGCLLAQAGNQNRQAIDRNLNFIK